jgi:hypothetical protein
MSILTVVGIIFAGLVGILAAREHRAALGARRSLLDRCAHVLDDAKIRVGRDGFPRLAGRRGGRDVVLDVIPDTMVMRRLPQLWASLTVLESVANTPNLAVLVRPAGYEFYSLTTELSYALDAQADLPREILVRASDARGEGLLHRLTPTLADILADPSVKEVAVTRRGLRLIWQLGEGRRGEHLLLRQAVFDGAELSAGDLTKRLGELDTLRRTLEMEKERRVA